MGSEDYTTPSRGSLKLKGVQGSKVEKRKKKKRPKESQEGTSSVEDHAAADDKAASADGEAVRKRTLDDALESEDEKGEDREIASGAGKTEAEKRYQERRRKMVSPSRSPKVAIADGD